MKQRMRAPARQRASASAVADLREWLTGASIRTIAGIVDLGEIILAKIGNVDGGDAHVVHDKKLDAWVYVRDMLKGERPIIGRLFIPGGILFRKPKDDETAVVLRPRDGHGPGTSLVLPDGGDGTKAIIPDWFDWENAGLYDPDRNLRLDTPANGKAVIFQGGTLPMARKTDPLSVGTLTGTAGPYPVIFTYTPSVASGGSIIPGTPSVGPSASLAGVVADGAPKVKG